MHHTPPPAEGSFAATLPVLERRLAGRLEGFGDIVFGFAVSQCALELPTSHGRVDLTHPVALLFYFGTFALLASLWLTYHRLMSGTFRPRRIDLFLAFFYLALVSLMPYALYSISHERQTLEDARAAIAVYSALFATLMAVAGVIGFRNLRRGWWSMDDDERQKSWIAFLRRCALASVMTVAVIVDLTVGPEQATIPFFVIPFWIRLVVWLGKAPRPKLLGIEAPEPAPVTS
jgi:uncharacterized membrane protein